MKVGFIGLGEAGFSIAQGLHEEGVESIVWYDAMAGKKECASEFNRKGMAFQGRKVETAALVCEKAEVIFAAVPAAYSVAAAQEALPGMKAGSIYIDVSTATPAEKKKIGAMLKPEGVAFVDGAMMGALLRDRHRVPMLLSGPGAEAFKKSMDVYHMCLTVVGEEPGTATSIKFIRSITAKGIGCLLVESLQAAQKYGVEQTIVDSFCNSFGPGFLAIINGYVSGAIIHAERREHEMQNVVDFLKQSDLPYGMAEAVRQKLAWLRDGDVKGNFKGGVPRNWEGILAGWQLNDR